MFSATSICPLPSGSCALIPVLWDVWRGFRPDLQLCDRDEAAPGPYIATKGDLWLYAPVLSLSLLWPWTTNHQSASHTGNSFYLSNLFFFAVAHPRQGCLTHRLLVGSVAFVSFTSVYMLPSLTDQLLNAKWCYEVGMRKHWQFVVKQDIQNWNWIVTLHFFFSYCLIVSKLSLLCKTYSS